MLVLLLPLLAFDSGEKYLGKIELFQKDSYFKSRVYTEHDWKSFAKMDEPNAIVEPDHYDIHLLNASIFYATAKLREEKGIKTTKYSDHLRDAAMVHSYQMVDRNFFNHFNNYVPALHSPEQRMKMFGVAMSELAENVDYTFISIPSKTTYLQIADKIVDDFFHSPPHRKNMLNKTFVYLGCAAEFELKDKQGVRYVKATQDYSAAY